MCIPEHCKRTHTKTKIVSKQLLKSLTSGSRSVTGALLAMTERTNMNFCSCSQLTLELKKHYYIH